MNLFKSTKATTYISSRGDKVYPIIMDIKTGIVEGDAVFTTGDIDTAYLYATILEEQSDYNILGSTVICNIQRPDGTTMKVQGDVLGNNLIEFPLGQSGVSQEGVYNFDIAVVFSEKKMVTSPTAQYSVTQSIEVIGEIEEDDRFPVLESLISGINVINEEELVRVSNEEVRQSKEEAREQAESVRARNEETRLANNEAIRNEEAVRVVNENERKNAESLRVQEENKRKQQENTRIAQENTRVSQETARVNTENTRKNQEATRQANEATRVSQETNRSQAESTRNSNETVRQNQENTRKNQEQARVTAEGNRVTSENVRVSAEQARVLKEQERQAIEVERQNSESTREQQEATRVSQENARKQADVLRQQEHESRQQFLDGFEGKLNTVVDDVATIKDDVVSVREANKRQDVFLQGLYNENLDGRVTVKEEGSVISLTNSADGLVDIVGLEGNTLVNYVQDGAKELTLNGDIDVEGTNVTITDTVDNGLVDVVCEGNTLVNLMPNIDYSSPNINDGTRLNYFSRVFPLIQNNKTYTIVFNNYCFTEFYLVGLGISWINITNKNIFTFTVNADDSTFDSSSPRNFMFRTTRELTSDELMNLNFILLEGDYTNKPIPSYFEGMKSVGECEDNKIEILSKNVDFIELDNMVSGSFDTNGNAMEVSSEIRTENFIKLPNGCTRIYFDKIIGSNNRVWCYDENKNLIGVGSEATSDVNEPITLRTGTKYIRCRFLTNDLSTKVILFFENKVEPKLNKKEIILSEPLRALPNGVKDKVVKVGGKWYVERNCGSVVLDGSEAWGDYNMYTNDIITTKATRKPSDCKSKSEIVCGGFYTRYPNGVDESISIGLNNLELSIKTSKLSSQTVTDFKKWLSANPTTIVYELETPTYEELPIDPTLNTYNDITHISNNSNIPCNMKVTNTGYNAIIKPSTQYTVAFDTNKSGEVGINLGGSKVTTTNNVATVTTPSTLVDDTLRLTGKGIKASKVRLLEGDKTNCIPSHFEGMKSSFEDKLQDDGTYKMEILSNNRNLFDINKVHSAFTVNNNTISKTTTAYNTSIFNNTVGLATKQDVTNLLKLKKGMYTFGCDTNSNIVVCLINDDGTYKNILFEGTSENSKGVFILPKNSYIDIKLSNPKLDYVVSNIQIEEGNTLVNYNYEPHKSNKIQFSSIEPLRGVGDVKDRFVFKDGKLMVERNCGIQVLTGTESWSIMSHYELDSSIVLNSTVLGANYPLSTKDIQYGRCSKFCNGTYSTNNPTVNSVCLMDNHKGIRFRVHKTLANNKTEWCEYLKNNNLEYIYPLAEPTYEEVPYEAQKIILEGYINGTLFLDTNIPPTVTASYTANIPVVSKLNKVNETTETNTEDIAITQMAVDFLLMSTLGEEMLNFKVKSGYNMASYFASRIIKGALKYEDVVNKYPQYKEEIDSILETK